MIRRHECPSCSMHDAWKANEGKKWPAQNRNFEGLGAGPKEKRDWKSLIVRMTQAWPEKVKVKRKFLNLVAPIDSDNQRNNTWTIHLT